MIKVFLTGRLGKDAEVRITTTGGAVAGFSVATDVGFGDRKQTLWFDCSIWGKRAESGLIQHLTKGQQVAIVGELSEREHDGKVYKQIRVDDLDLMGGKQASAQVSSDGPSQVFSGASSQVFSAGSAKADFQDSASYWADDIPF